MRRTLLDNVKVSPYTSAAVIDRQGFLSGILALKITSITGSPSAASVSIAATECDTSNGTFTNVADTKLFVNGNTATVDLTNGLEKNFGLDFLGCKRYIKLAITVSFTGGTNPSSTNAYAIALGDATEQPV